MVTESMNTEPKLELLNQKSTSWNPNTVIRMLQENCLKKKNRKNELRSHSLNLHKKVPL